MGFLQLKQHLLSLPRLQSHPHFRELIEIVSGDTAISSANYPYICESSFKLMIQEVPHLFQNGLITLDWLSLVEAEKEQFSGIGQAPIESLERALKVLRTIIFTAAITAPPDLWVLRHVLSTHQTLGTLDFLLAGATLEVKDYAQKNRLNAHQLSIDLQFLHSRGYLLCFENCYRIPQSPVLRGFLESFQPLGQVFLTNITGNLIEWLSSTANTEGQTQFIKDWLEFRAPKIYARPRWIANAFDLEAGYRLVPLVLSFRALGLTTELKQGVILNEAIPNLLPEMICLFEETGLARLGRVTRLGQRVFK